MHVCHRAAVANSTSQTVAVEIPSNLALKVLRPQYWITGNMILWAICTVCLGLVKTGGQLIAVRFLLGLFEGGLFPGLNFIFSLYYTREELGQRVAIFFAGATRKSTFTKQIFRLSLVDRANPFCHVVQLLELSEDSWVCILAHRFTG